MPGYALVIEIKRDGAPRFVRAGALQLKGYLAVARESRPPTSDRHLIPMLVAPYLSPASRSICLDHDVAYADLPRKRPPRLRRRLHRASRRRHAQVRNPRSQVDLRAEGRRYPASPPSRSSQGLASHRASPCWPTPASAMVSNVRKALLAREWIEKRTDGIVLIQPADLMRTWREEYRAPSGVRSSGYTIYHGEQLNRRLKGVLNSKPRRARVVYSLNSAAQWFAPFLRGPTTHSFYADAPGARLLKEAIKLSRIDKGANSTCAHPERRDSTRGGRSTITGHLLHQPDRHLPRSLERKRPRSGGRQPLGLQVLPMAVIEPQSAAEYDDRTTAAVKSVLIEIRQVLGDFCGKFVVVGGAVPWAATDPSRHAPHRKPSMSTSVSTLLLSATASMPNLWKSSRNAATSSEPTCGVFNSRAPYEPWTEETTSR